MARRLRMHNLTGIALFLFAVLSPTIVAAAATVTVSPTAVAAGALITTTVAGGPGNVGDWVALNPVGGADQSYVQWQYLNGSTTAPTTGLTGATVTFTAPLTAGASYEVRWFSNNTYTRLATSATITVTGAGAPPTVTVSPTAAAPGATITATLANGPGAAGDWIALNPASGADQSYVQWKYLNGSTTPPATGLTNATVTFTAPTTAGATYEVRWFSNNTYTRLATSATITVTGGGTATVVVSPTTAAPGATVTATVANGPGAPGDWVALNPVSGADQAYVQWKYLNGLTTTPATGLTGATVTFTAPATAGSYEVRWFSNNTYNRLATSATITVGNTVARSIWSASATPSRIETTDNNAHELGTRFQADVDGTITGVRFYKGATNTGIHTGSLWTNAGALLGTATFANETASGWQQVSFSAPIAVTANTTYVVSYHTEVGQYGVSDAYFTTGVDNAPLHALADGVGGANSVFAYGASVFPTLTWQAANYWVDVVFMAGAGGADTTAPVVSMTAPAAGATVSGSAVTVSATASDNVGVAGVQFKLDGVNLGADDTASPYSVAWNTTTAANGTHTLTAVARDAAGNTTTAAVTVTVSNAAVDTTPPLVSMTAPAAGATVSGSAVTISATASDNVGVAGVQFKVDGVNLGAEDTVSPYSVAWNTTTATNGTHTLTAVARDAAGNTTTAAARTVTVSNAVARSIWSASATPSRIETTDNNAHELGARFQADVNGTITGVRFYKGATNTGIHTGSLWTNAGALLGTATFASETASGWQQVSFSAPIAVTANTTYVVSYHTEVGQYGVTDAYFTTGVDNAPLHALADGVGGASGVFAYGASAFPTLTWQAANYWVDVVFMAGAGGADTTAPVVSITAPGGGSTVSGSAVTVSATASDNVGVAGVQFKLDGVNLGAEDTATGYTQTWNTTTAANGTHTLTAVARDAAGNTTTAAAVTVTVSNAAADTTPPVVSMTAPSGGSTVSGTAVTVSATASDNIGVVGVQFKVDGVNLGAEDTTTAYSLTWNTTTIANGTHTVTAVARDAAGNMTTAAAVTVTVSNSAAVPTTVIFTASTDHSIVTSYRLEVFANGANPNTATPVATSNLGKPTPAANNDITVDQTSFFNGLAPATYVVTVSAVGTGGSGRSAAVTVTR